MNDQVKAFNLSLLVHALAVICLAFVGTVLMRPDAVLVIDLSDDISESSTLRGLHPSPPQWKKPVARDMEYQSPAMVAQPERRIEQSVEVKDVKDVLPLETQSAVASVSEKQNNPAAGSLSVAVSDSSLVGSGGQNPGQNPAGGTHSHGKQGNFAYLKKHYAYIRALIQKNLVYPAPARKMGWEGRVTVSFLILPDGRVGNVKVSRSSGRDILDRGAVETVKKTSPFPPPPAMAEIIIPVIYALR
ncbi:MAG: energy transducer TonB [Nitrospirota bacterium]